MTNRIDTAAERAKLAALEGHTPGPWLTRRAAGISSDIGILVDGGCVAECFADIREPHEGAVQEQYVNAQLCAAAPDLKAAYAAALDELDRLREALTHIATGEGFYGAQASEYKAIARAALSGEGET